MSDYRDDSTDTAVASSSTFIGLKSVVENLARASDALFFGIAITLSSTAIASDEVIDTSGYAFIESATVSDQVIDRLHASDLSTDKVRAAESWSYGLRVLHEDTAIASDEVIAGTTGSMLYSSAIASDEVTGHRIVRTLAIDTATASDSLTRITSDLIIDSAIANDDATGLLRAADLITATATASDELLGAVSSLITDTAIASDEVIAKRYVSALAIDSATAKDELLFSLQDIITDTTTVSDSIEARLYARDLITDTAIGSATVIDKIIQSNVITDTAKASDSVIDRLYAAMSWQDIVVVQDELINIGGYRGQTWTANVDSWAMSRYNPYNYNRLVVIDGTLYGEAEDGIYRLDQDVAPVVASLVTGKIDLGGGALTHPNAAYLEYELIGQASMTVHTTQKGVEQQYTYVLPNELADELTNGRFIFGRGLRGRHFSFELTMVGTHGYINDLSVEHQPSTRRI